MGLDQTLLQVNKSDFKRIFKVVGKHEAEVVDEDAFQELEEVTFFRKSYCLHNWLVAHKCIPVDSDVNGHCYALNQDTLTKLFNLCVKILRNKDTIMELSSKDNFDPIIVDNFYDDESGIDYYYFDEVEEVLDQIQEVLQDFDFIHNYLVYYES